ncbi:MAG: hypothetical protein ABI823_09100, partial [Bryobacteraceae bacterium]
LSFQGRSEEPELLDWLRTGMRSLLLIFALIAGAAAASGSAVQYLTNDDLVAKSTSIVRGKVLSEIGLVRRSTIYTSYRVQVLEVPGGVAQGYREIVSGAPTLMDGNEYVLFLWTSPSGLTQILGLSQGLFIAVKQADGTVAAVRPGGADATLIDIQTGRTVSDKGSQLSLGDIRKRVAQGKAATK